MDKFERENRYIVLKRKHLANLPDELQHRLKPALEEAAQLMPKGDFLVIENDWPEYEQAWAAIESRMTGKAQSVPDVNAELLAALEAALQWIEDSGELTARDTIDVQVRAAIAKAKGGAS